MNQDKLSMRQIMVISCGGLISPVSLLLPQMTAERGGAIGWISPLLALLLLLLMGGCLFLLFRNTTEGIGFGQILETALGKWIGRIVTALYYIWCVLLLSLFTRIAATRLSDAYQTDSTVLFCIILLGMVCWMAIGKVSAFGRASEVFYMALAVIMGAILLYCVFQIQWDYVAPKSISDITGGIKAVFPVLGIISVSIYSTFLGGWVKRRKENVRRGFGWLIMFCFVFTVLLLVVSGRLGSTLTSQLNMPFFTLVEDIGVKGAFQRMEALVGAVWVLSDLTLMGMLALTSRTMIVTVIPAWKKAERWLAFPAIMIAVIAAIYMPSGIENSTSLWNWIFGGNTIIGIAIPVIVLFAIGVRKSVKR